MSIEQILSAGLPEAQPIYPRILYSFAPLFLTAAKPWQVVERRLILLLFTYILKRKVANYHQYQPDNLDDGHNSANFGKTIPARRNSNANRNLNLSTKSVAKWLMTTFELDVGWALIYLALTSLVKSQGNLLYEKTAAVKWHHPRHNLLINSTTFSLK
ncbi:hypothetical protein BC941DRAFT_472207 [Chlamydoabsidia padenii]|nr:hypothetical protein BC941DRAFT_472207 [Chlamydoabsidia padenii]